MHDGEILRYADLIDGQCVSRVKETPKLPIIANSTISQAKKSIKPHDIKHWHSRIENLGYRSLTIPRNLSSRIGFHGGIPAELCEHFRKRDQTRQLSNSPISQVKKFLGRVNSDLEGPFLRARQGYRYYISFLEESTCLIDIEPLNVKVDALTTFKNCKALREKQSGCQLKILHKDRGG